MLRLHTVWELCAVLLRCRVYGRGEDRHQRRVAGVKIDVSTFAVLGLCITVLVECIIHKYR